MKVLAFFFLLVASKCNCDETINLPDEKFYPAKTTLIGNSTSRGDLINALIGKTPLRENGCKKDSCEDMEKRLQLGCTCCEVGIVAGMEVAYCCCYPDKQTCFKDSGLWMCSGQASIGINVAVVFMLMSAIFGRCYFL